MFYFTIYNILVDLILQTERKMTVFFLNLVNFMCYAHLLALQCQTSWRKSSCIVFTFNYPQGMCLLKY